MGGGVTIGSLRICWARRGSARRALSLQVALCLLRKAFIKALEVLLKKFHNQTIDVLFWLIISKLFITISKTQLLNYFLCKWIPLLQMAMCVCVCALTLYHLPSVHLALNAFLICYLFVPNLNLLPCSNTGVLQPIQHHHLGGAVWIYTPCSVNKGPGQDVRPQFLGRELNSWQMLWMILGTNL